MRLPAMALHRAQPLSTMEQQLAVVELQGGEQGLVHGLAIRAPVCPSPPPRRLCAPVEAVAAHRESPAASVVAGQMVVAGVAT